MKEFTAEEQMENWYKLIEFITRPFDPLIIKITNYERI